MTIDLKVETWPTSRFVPYARNLRKNGHAVERMIASIRAYGFAIPILSRGNGEIVDGHLRFMAARRLGLEELPTIVCDTWSEPQVRAFRLLVNRSANWATWDADLVALEIQELQAVDFDLDLTGFDPIEIDHFLLDQEDSEEEIPPVPGDRGR